METGDIKKFQSTKASDIEYTFNDTEQQYKSATNISIQKKLKSLYTKKKIRFSRQYYPAWMNLPKGIKATLKLTTIYLDKWEEAENEEYITFKPNTDYDISYDGQLNNTIKIPLKKKDKASYNIEITVKNETITKSYIEAIDEQGLVVGIIEMHPNKKIPLDIKIIPVVFKSREGDEISEVISLYSKTIKAKTKDLGNNLNETLNKHSLNQAGIQSKIEAIKETSIKSDGTIEKGPQRIVIDLTKDNWVNFYDSAEKEFKDWEFDPTEPNATKRSQIWTNEDGGKNYEYKEYEVEDKDTLGIVIGTKKMFKTKNNKRLLLDKLEEKYYTIYGKGFKGALLFVTEQNYNKPNTLGYSQNNPLRNQGTIIFKGGLSMSDVYAHELGHMLGLEHVFLKAGEDDEIKGNIKLQETNITIYQENVKKREREIDSRNKTIIRLTEDTKKYGYNEDGTIDIDGGQEYIDKQQVIIDKYQAEIDECNNDIKDFQDNIEDFKRKIAIEKGRGFKIKKGTSNSFMNYDISRLYFDKFQCLVMQQEVKKYYNE